MKEDITIFSVDRPLSWSAISTFEYDREQFYQKYWLGEKSPDTKETLFGKMVGERLASDPDFLPQVPRRPIFEHGIRADVAGLPIIGYLDTYEKGVGFDEFKTGKKPWNQERVDNHGQITMYFLLLYLAEQLTPDELQAALHWLPTQDMGDFTIDFVDDKDVKSFPTTRTMRQLLEFGTFIHQKHKEMLEFVKYRSTLPQRNPVVHA